jgi:hypothetical protein
MGPEGATMSKLGRLIATEEGYGKPGAVPTRDDNPGDLRHSPHSTHLATAPDGIGIIDTPEDGWADLERQLELYADRGMTLQQAIFEFAPPEENDSARYLAFICQGLGLPATTSVAEALKLA